MLFASSFFPDPWIVISVFAIWALVLKRFLTRNPEVGKHANDAAKNAAINFISRIFRK
jgi:hypothetical protein